MSNLGSMITAFTPAYAACTTSLWYRGFSNRGGDLVLGLPGHSSTLCLPPDFRYGATNYYSPGICPIGYSYGCVATKTASGREETTATCCPSGWECRSTSAAYACVSFFPSETTLTLGSYELSTPASATTTTELITGSTTTVRVTQGGTAYAWGPIVRRASTDPTWPAATATAAASSTASSSLLPSGSTTASAATATAAASSSTLSTGAKAGIAVGVSVAGLLVIAACIAACLLRRKRRRQRHELPPMSPDAAVAPIAELPADTPKSPQELHGNSLLEAPVDNAGEKGQSGERPAELLGT